MGLGQTFRRSRDITKISFGVVKKDREMLWFPFLASIFSIAYSIALLFPTIISYFLIDGGDFESMEAIQYVWVFLTYLGLAFIATFFNVCVVYTTKTRFEGGDATFGDSIRFAFSRLHMILMWSLLSATVGLLLYMLDSLARNSKGVGRALLGFLRSILAMAWSIITIFVVPGMVYYRLSPFDAIKKSGEVLKKTWGESIVRHYGLGFIRGLFFFLGIVLTLVFVFVLIPLGTWAIWFTVIFALLYFVITGLVFNVLNQVYNTALFVYADSGKIPGGFSAEYVEHGFREDVKTSSR